MLTKREFDLLVLLLNTEIFYTQRELAEKMRCSVGTINKLLKNFIEKGYYNGREITEEGKVALEPYRVSRAIFLAAGFGSRLVPITLNTPKPLVRVNGKRMIDTLLDAVVAARIPEIVIVRGYLGEQFDQLLEKYPNIKFVENPLFNETNNISSAMCVKNLLKKAYVLEADLVLSNPKLIRTYEYQTNILGIYMEQTDDWSLKIDENGYVVEENIGGKNCYQMIGISYWDEDDGSKLECDLEKVFMAPGGKERYWEQTAMVYEKQNYHVFVRECESSDIVEIDTFSELKQIDKSYGV